MSEKEIMEQQIRNLECDLTASDYKIIKCYEYGLIGEELPYDIEQLHIERQSIRDEINVLKERLKEQE